MLIRLKTMYVISQCLVGVFKQFCQEVVVLLEGLDEGGEGFPVRVAVSEVVEQPPCPLLSGRRSKYVLTLLVTESVVLW